MTKETILASLRMGVPVYCRAIGFPPELRVLKEVREAEKGHWVFLVSWPDLISSDLELSVGYVLKAYENFSVQPLDP